MSIINQPFGLYSGGALKNRLVKAAMTEGLAERGVPGSALVRLYRRWGAGGAGALITGNVIIDRNHLERPGNVVLDREPDRAMRDALARWAAAGQETGAAMIMQLSHAGRQTPRRVNPRPKAPSAVPVALPGRQFGDPAALAGAEIAPLVEQFAMAASAAKEAGFAGVQVHAAHGYLISEFLSPKSNLRADAYGGSLENRARFLLETVAAVRRAVGDGFPVSVKLNSADFQKGGFVFEDSMTVAGWLADAGVDFLELSGGCYEQPRMVNVDGLRPPEQSKLASTRAREGYFLDFARAMLAARTPPLMVTGGFRSRAVMEEALAAGVSLVGVARPLCVDPGCAAALLEGARDSLPRPEDALRLGPGVFGPASPFPVMRAINGFATLFWYYQQLRRMGKGLGPDSELGMLAALISERRDDARLLRER